MSSPNITKSLIGLQNWIANQIKESPILEKQLSDLSKQAPSSGPPRPGLQWKPQTHRWIRPRTDQKPIKMFGNTFEPNQTVIQSKGSGGKWRNYGPPIKTQEDAQVAEKLINEGVGAVNSAHGGIKGSDGNPIKVAYGEYRVAHKGKSSGYPRTSVVAHPGNKPPKKHKGWGRYEQ